MRIKKVILKTKLDDSSDAFIQQGERSMFYENDLFKGLKPEQLDSLFKKMNLRNYAAGNIIFTPEDPTCENLYLLNQGQVEMYRLTISGKRLVTRHISQGEVFGVRGLFGRGMQKNFAEATAESTIGVIAREQVLGYLQHHPDLMLRILDNLCCRLYLLEDRLLEAAYNPVSIRLAYFLLTNADAASGMLTDITHEEIGNRIGAVRQTVAENLSLLRKQGLIQTQPGQIRVIDRHRLEAVIRDK
jgi:CRP-like cAMP-binding protein